MDALALFEQLEQDTLGGAPVVKAGACGPLSPCKICNWPCFWLDGDRWYCSRCYPRPVPFLGRSVVVPGGDLAPEEEPIERPEDELTEVVTCKKCRHFEPWPDNPHEAAGECKTGAYADRREVWFKNPIGSQFPEPPLYPFAERRCDQFEARV